mgnify:CR=1 FL=1
MSFNKASLSNFISLSWEVKTVQSDFEHPKGLRTQGVSDSQHLYPGDIGLLLLPDHQISLFGVLKYNHLGAMSQGRSLFHGLRFLLQYHFKHDGASMARFHSTFLFYLKTVLQMRQVALWVYELTYSVNQS